MRIFLPIIVLLALAACSGSSGSPVRPDGPGSGHEPPAWTCDASLRFEIGDLCLRFDDGGLIFGAEADGTHFVTNLADGFHAALNETRGTLEINGQRLSTHAMRVEKKSGDTLWISALTDEIVTRNVIFVTVY